MAWIEVHQSLLTHRKTLRLCRLLKMDKYAVTGRLMALWCWALDNAQDGFIHVGDSDLLADVMGWDEPTEKLITALISAGFIDLVEEGYQIHDWEDYAGKLIDHRKANASRQKAWRDRKREYPSESEESNELRNGNITVTSQSRNGATVPNPTQPNSTQHNHRNSSASVSNGYQKSSSSKRDSAREKPTTTALSKNLTYEEKAHWVADVPDDLQLSWTVNDRRDALEKMLCWCKENGHKPSEMRYHKWLKDERNHVPENATEVEKLERILASVNKETGICSNGQTYTNNMEKLRSARQREKATRERDEHERAWGEAELVHMEPGDSNSTH